MFAELADSSWANRSHRGWAAFASFSVQALAVSILFLLPTIYTEGLPSPLTMRTVLPVPPPAPPPRQTHQTIPATSNMSTRGEVIEPPSVPRGVSPIDEQVAPPPVDLAGFEVACGTGDSRAQNPVLNLRGRGLDHTVLPPPSVEIHQRPISHMMEGNLVYRIQPEYPALARQVRVQGTVVLRAVISREGAIENLQVLSGHPLLVKAAMEAVRQWRYRPYVLNGEPVEVETQVTVNFILSGG
jgi:periplasmic protein TonB